MAPGRMFPGNLYVLDENNKPVPEPDVLTWAAWLQSEDRHVGYDSIGDALVSTVFLGINSRWLGNGDPILWETMILGGPLDGYQERYCSHEDAVQGHKRALEVAERAAERDAH